MRISTPPMAMAHHEMSPQRLDTIGGMGPSEVFAPHVPIHTAPNCFMAQVLVPEPMVGSVLGRQGSALAELQMLTGTLIRVSQRGEYMPGTRSRIVTLRGPTAQSVWQAQFMMGQRMVLPSTAVHPPLYPAKPDPTMMTHYGSSYDDAPVDPVTPPRDIHQDGNQDDVSDPENHSVMNPSGNPLVEP
jgi:hypothetical protein